MGDTIATGRGQFLLEIGQIGCGSDVDDPGVGLETNGADSI